MRRRHMSCTRSAITNGCDDTGVTQVLFSYMYGMSYDRDG